MTQLNAILTDPNYVNANAATKQAIFDKFSAQDTDFTGANAATQQAIRLRFGVTLSATPPTTPPVSADAPPKLTSGQRIYQAVRPYVAPVVEMAGTIGGGLVGFGGGAIGGVGIGAVPGSVLGAGLGYGIAREMVEGADVAMGMKPPRQGAAIALEPAKNVLEGATYEVGGRVIAPYVSKAIGKVVDLANIPANKAATIARNALGPDLPEVINMLKAAQDSGLSSAQATAGVNSPVWQTLLDRALARDPRFGEALKAAQGEVSVNALARLAGGATATDVRAATTAAKAGLTAETGVIRETALDRANLGRTVAEYEAQAGKLSAEASAEVQKVRNLVNAGDIAEAAARFEMIRRGLPVSGARYTYPAELAVKADEWASTAANASLALGEGKRFAQAAADTLRASGIKPLTSDSVIIGIRNSVKNPNFAGNDVLLGAVKNVADDIAKWTDGGGIIDARALEAIRKNSVNAAISQLRPGIDATAQRNLAAGVMTDLKPLIVDAIEGAGGTGYRQYLADYSKGMQRIAEQKLTGEALRLWKTDKDAFVRLVQNESPEVVEKFLGAGRYNIAAELTETTMSILRDQATKRLTDITVKGQAGAGQDALRELLMDNMSKFRMPSYLSMLASSTNKALGIIEKRIGDKTMARLTEAAKTPGGAVRLLETLPAAESVRVLKILANPASWVAKPGVAAATAIGVKNALIPEDAIYVTPQNALVQ